MTQSTLEAPNNPQKTPGDTLFMDMDSQQCQADIEAVPSQIPSNETLADSSDDKLWLRPEPEPQAEAEAASDVNTLIDPEELKLPKISSFAIVIIGNLFLQISFFIVVSSANDYVQHLGGNSTFSGVVIGIPTVFSSIALIPLVLYDKGGYSLPINVSCGSSIIGHILYACAFKLNCLYLILIGRIVNGFGFAMWMYCKRYCSDARIVGVRRRTTLACFLVMGQGLGMSIGPFAGGLLYKVGFKNSIFNGYTSPGWVMAAVWCVFWVCVRLFYVDVPADARYPGQSDRTTNTSEPSTDPPEKPTSLIDVVKSEKTDEPPTPRPSSKWSFLQKYQMPASQWPVLGCMCWFAITCYFILGAWEANLAVFGADTPQLHWSPTAAGNFIALGGVTALPFFILNAFLIRRVEDRKLLAAGSSLTLSALIVFLALLQSQQINYASVFMCWWAVALGLNAATTLPVSLLSKQLPPGCNNWLSFVIQNCVNVGRVFGAVWGGSGVRVGMSVYVGLEIATIGIGIVMFVVLWDKLKAKKG